MVVMTQEIILSDYDGNYEAFLEACYQAYLNFWATSPTFQGKTLQRNINKISNGKEDDFWGIVDGHDQDKDHGTERYGKVPFLGHVFAPENISSQDVVFVRRLHQRKIRIEVFSHSKSYLVVLQEIGGHERLQFVTAHPLGTKQLQKKLKSYEEYCRNGGEPL